jgi:carbon-monoxide dehydrogenase medium subunit
MLLTKAGLAGVRRDGKRIAVGATTPVQELVSLPAPVGPCAANVADLEIRSQGTIGGNLCAGRGREAPRGDLQGALLAVDATVRSTGAGGEKTQALEEFLAVRNGRLVLEIAFDEPAAGAFAALDRPHTHDYTALAVSAARTQDGTVRLAATGVADHAVRLLAAEAKAHDPQAAGEAAVADATFADDALASAWYRERTLPVLVRRALTQLQEAT